VLTHVADVLDGRSATMTNLNRAGKLLQLVQADLNGKANELVWAHRIRSHLLEAEAIARPQRQNDDPFGKWSLVSPPRRGRVTAPIGP
jgi:hypothetical protein